MIVQAELDRIKAIVGEKFDDYLIVVVKEGDIFSTYKSRVAAYGMCTMTKDDIDDYWQKCRENKLEGGDE